MAVPFAHGVHDVFQYYAAGSNRTIAFQRAREMWSSHIRHWVSWTDVQQWGPNSYHWKPEPGDIHWVGFVDWDHEAARAEANSRDLRTHVFVTGCPTGWIPRSERAPCRPELEATTAPWNMSWYPTSSSARDHFANFCVETLKYFDNCQRVDAIEVWNEPNLGGDNQILSGFDYKQILDRVCQKVAAANAAGYFSHPMKVVSGGLYMDWSPGYWKGYLDVFKDVHPDLAIGIHPYDTRDHNGFTSAQWSDAADAVYDRIKALYDQAEAQTTHDLWITETGASSRPPFTQDGQKRAIRKLAGRASNGGYFATRPRCKAAFLYRHYPGSSSEQPGEPAAAFFRFSLHDENWNRKLAADLLINEWGP